MTELLLVIHILSAAAWIGGAFLSGFVAPRLARSGVEGATLAWRVLEEGLERNGAATEAGK